MPNSHLDLNAIRCRAAAATPGPWVIGSEFGAGTLGSSAAIMSGKLPPIKLDPHRNGASDAAFIARARQDVPALLAEVERLRDDRDELVALFDLQQKRMAEATTRWRAEDPEARARTLPDLGALLQWLMDDADRARGVTRPYEQGGES